MPAPSLADLHREFGGAKLEADAAAESMSICQTFGLGAGELFIRWQTFVINQHGGDASVQPTRERLLEVRSMLQQELERKASQRRGAHPSQVTKLARNRERAHYDKNSVEGLLQGMVAGSQRDPMKTPQSTKRVGLLRGSGASAARGRPMVSPMSPSVFAEPSPSALRYLKRTNTGRTEEALHSELPPLRLPQPRAAVRVCDLGARPGEAGTASSDESDGDGDSASSESKGNDKGAAPRHTAKRMRYMFEKMGARTETVNKRIERVAVDVKAEYKIEALANPTYPHQNTVTAVGRIMSIGADEGLSAAPISGDSLCLETSRRLGNGRRIALDVRAAPSFSLFPGQVVAVDGKNLKGTEFSVAQFRQLPRPMRARISERSGGVSAFSAVVASGPYTLADNLEYEPLGDLVGHVLAAAPCAVFLLGPFVSEAHPMLRDGQADMAPEEVFCAKISPQLARLREGLPSTASVFLVPSPDELCCPYAAFPQPPFDHALLLQLGVPAGVASLSNPAQLAINGVNVAISNIDFLLHLVKEEVSRLPAVSDRLPRLAWHLAEQQHFYPLSPPPPECAAILASHDSKLRMHAMPDILITPSQLKQFARVQDNTVLLNPGQSSRGLAGGTFAKLSVHSPESTELAGVMLGGSEGATPADYIGVEIVRI